MRSPRFLIAMLVVSVTTVAIARNLFPHRMRARRRCALPGYDYQPRSTRSRKIDVATTAQEIDNPAKTITKTVTRTGEKTVTKTVTETEGKTTTETVTETGGKTVTETATTVRKKIRVFQQGSSGLIDDHCAISGLTVVLDESGQWIVSLDAEQNPQRVSSVSDRPAFERFLRNRFYVELRGLGLARDSSDPNDKVLAPPQLFQIKLPVFQVEKGQTRSLRFQGSIENPNIDVQKYFSQIDRVEIHFHYE